MRKFTTLALALIATIGAMAQNGEKWSVVGDMHYGNKIWQATLVAYDDATYTIQDWYGHEGYDISFKLNRDGTLHFINYVALTENATDTYAIFEAYNGLEVGFYQDSRSGFEGNPNEGRVYFGGEVWESIQFTWPAADWTAEGKMTIEDKSGNIIADYNAYISAMTNHSYVINGWHGDSGLDLCFTVNEDGTLEITNGFTIGAAVPNVTTVYAEGAQTVKLYTGLFSMIVGDRNYGKVVFHDVNGNKYRLLWPLKYEGSQWMVFGDIEIPYGDKPINRNIQMIANDDDSYTLVSWYADGYNLSFTVNEDGTLHFLYGNPVPYDPTYYQVPYCQSPIDPAYDDNTWLYQDANSSFYLNESDNSGNLSFTDYRLCFNTVTSESKPITFVWGPVNVGGENPYEDPTGEPSIPASVNGLNGETFSVSVIGGDINVPEGAAVYDVNGRRVEPRNLSTGVYIVRKGNTSLKVAAGR